MKRRVIYGLVAAGVLTLSAVTTSWAHCDGLDGPVVTAARAALEKKNVNLVLIWVQPAYEAEIRSAFDQTLTVRTLGPQAKELADRYFFETLVRLHRAGESAPYTGLKPAGRDLGQAIPVADKALDSNDIKPLLLLMSGEVRAGLEEQFKTVIDKKKYDPADLAAGREYVGAYVTFIHYVERLHEAAVRPVHGHEPEAESAEMHGEHSD